jgi:hypothetical protein
MKQLDVGPLALLEERLRAFDTLIERADHERAAVVADAIEELVAGFDGKALLSRVLARFYAQVCEKAGDLEEASEKRGTLRGRALRQLFRLDLAAFLKKED